MIGGAMAERTNLDIDLVRGFVAVAETRSFSRAGDRLLRSQSTVSLQIKRLESQLNRRLFDRTPRAVKLTAEGEAFLVDARRLLDANDAAIARLSEPDLRGLVRLGTPEDFATSHLPDVLARFAKAHPHVALEVTCDLTLNLLARFETGAFDLVLVKRQPSARADGIRVWREKLVWVAGGEFATDDPEPLPLVVSPAPCVYRKRATEALDAKGRSWRVAYTCASLAGQMAAVRAGLGVSVLPRDMVPQGLRALEGRGLPKLDDSEIAVLDAGNLSTPARRLREHIVRSLEEGA
jgi:DNA-binding transcriptional LysR family regulator